MFRSTLIAAGAVVLCSSGYAQQLDPAKIHPITVPVRDAGTFNWDTKQWVSGPKANRLQATAYTVFNNTCTWTGGGFYYGGFEHCEELIDTGRIPSVGTPLSSLEGSPGALNGVQDSQIINNYEFSYCTFFVNGTVDITIGFYDNLRGDCAAGVPVRGRANSTTPYQTLTQQAVPFGTLTAYFDFGSAAGNTLPGSTTNGDQSCWIVTITFANNGGFCLQSEGDGNWDNNQVQDLFSWSFSHDMANSLHGDNGPIISGEPLTGGYGAGAFNLPQGSDAIFGNPCGTGFGTSVDGWWLNIAGSPPGIPNTVVSSAVPNPATHQATCVGASGFGTNCYWFGGWPANPLGSFWMIMGSTGDCNGCNNRANGYCTAGTSAQGCNALISASGSSSATATTGFFLNASGVEANKSGLFYYSALGAKSPATSIGTSSSYQCVQTPVKRSAFILSSGGTTTPPGGGAGTLPNCDGAFSADLNARWTAKPAANPGVGASVAAQAWYRDPQNSSNQTTSRSDAVIWTVCP
jgi:hypothetical protein